MGGNGACPPRTWRRLTGPAPLALHIRRRYFLGLRDLGLQPSTSYPDRRSCSWMLSSASGSKPGWIPSPREGCPFERKGHPGPPTLASPRRVSIIPPNPSKMGGSQPDPRAIYRRGPPQRRSRVLNSRSTGVYKEARKGTEGLRSLARVRNRCTGEARSIGSDCLSSKRHRVPFGSPRDTGLARGRTTGSSRPSHRPQRHVSSPFVPDRCARSFRNRDWCTTNQHW